MMIGPPLWDDRPVVLIGGGPSLTGFDLASLDPGALWLCGVNQSMFDAPVHAGGSMDLTFIRKRAVQLAEFARARELYLTLGAHWRTFISPVEGAIYLPQSEVDKGKSSGYAMMGVALAKGARRVVLLGFDYNSIDGRHHYHDSYAWFRPDGARWELWSRDFDKVAVICRSRGVEVVNASPESKLTCFPKMTIADALSWAT